MKPTLNHTSHTSNYPLNETFGFRPFTNFSYEPFSFHYELKNQDSSFFLPRQNSLLTDEAASEMALGTIPNLEHVCRDLINTFFHQQGPSSALQFIPILQKLVSIDPAEAQRFMENPQTNHVLVKNDLLKVVLIHWKPGKVSSIHGHAKGGCVFKVLQGRLEEKRYSTDGSEKLLAVSRFQKGSMAYIDDNMAYHAVGNPFHLPAISLHAYTPGM